MHTPSSALEAPRAVSPTVPGRSPIGRRRSRGFTLIELMIGVSVVGVLSGIALPSFESQLQRSRRTDVLVAMMQIQMAQERFRSNATGYGNLADIGVPSVSPARHYTLRTQASGADSYEALGTATGVQARDAACRYMLLRAVGANLSHSSGPDASVANAADTNRKCWSL